MKKLTTTLLFAVPFFIGAQTIIPNANSAYNTSIKIDPDIENYFDDDDDDLEVFDINLFGGSEGENIVFNSWLEDYLDDLDSFLYTGNITENQDLLGDVLEDGNNPIINQYEYINDLLDLSENFNALNQETIENTGFEPDIVDLLEQELFLFHLDNYTENQINWLSLMISDPTSDEEEAFWTGDVMTEEEEGIWSVDFTNVTDVEEDTNVISEDNSEESLFIFEQNGDFILEDGTAFTFEDEGSFSIDFGGDISFDGEEGSFVFDRNDVKVFPNPFSSKNNLLSISYTGLKSKETLNIEIFNYFGQKVVSTKKNVSLGNNEIAINASNLIKGTYVVKIQTPNGVISKQLLVK